MLEDTRIVTANSKLLKKTSPKIPISQPVKVVVDNPHRMTLLERAKQEASLPPVPVTEERSTVIRIEGEYSFINSISCVSDDTIDILSDDITWHDNYGFILYPIHSAIPVEIRYSCNDTADVTFIPEVVTYEPLPAVNRAETIMRKIMWYLCYEEPSLSAAIKYATPFSNLQDVFDSFYKDLKKYNTHLCREFLEKECGIIIGDGTFEDTGSIRGKDAGGDTIYTRDSIMPDKLLTEQSSDLFSVKGITFKVPNYSSLTAKQEKIIRFIYQVWAEAAINLIEEMTGIRTDKEVLTKRGVKSPVTVNLLFDHLKHGNTALATSDTITWDIDVVESMTDNDWQPISQLQGTYGWRLDRVFLHEMVHLIMYNWIDKSMSTVLPQWFIEGGTAELIHGIDDQRVYAIFDTLTTCDRSKMASVDTSVNSEHALDVYEELRYHKPGDRWTSQEYPYAGGYILMRYILKKGTKHEK